MIPITDVDPDHLAELLAALSRWPGRRQQQLALAGRGFNLDAEFESVLFKIIGEQYKAETLRYLDEVALERMGAAFRVDCWRRSFAWKPTYRSEYLDLLHGKNIEIMPGPGIYSQDPGLQKFMYMHVHGGMLNEQTVFDFCLAETRETKIREIKRHQIAMSTEPIDRESTSIWLEEFSSSLGFRLKSKWWRKIYGNALELRMRIDRGRRTTWRHNLGLEYELQWKSISLRYSPVKLLGFFDFYERFAHPCEAHLGVMASVALLDSMGTLIEKGRV